MNSHPLFTSLSFSIGDYQLTCSVQQKKLKISVSALNQTIRQTLSLSQFINNDQSIDIWISRRLEAENSKFKEKNGETQNDIMKNAFLMKKLELLEKSYRSLQYKFQNLGQDRKQWLKNPKNQAKNSLSPSNCLLSSPNKAKNYASQLSSNKLGQILTEKDQEIYLLERKVNQRDELVRQLADGLMAANSEKQEIFNQYQKMLQTIVFQKADETTVVPIKVKDQKNCSQEQTQIIQQTKPQGLNSQFKQPEIIQNGLEVVDQIIKE